MKDPDTQAMGGHVWRERRQMTTCGVVGGGGWSRDWGRPEKRLLKAGWGGGWYTPEQVPEEAGFGN